MNPPSDPREFWPWYWGMWKNPVVIDRIGVVRPKRRWDGWVPPRRSD